MLKTVTLDIAPLCTACFGAQRVHKGDMSTVSKIKPFPRDFRLTIDIVTNKYFRNYKHVRSAYSISLHKCIMCSPCTCHLCALQIQKLSEHKGAMSTMSPLCSYFLPSLGKKWTCHQSVSARSPLKQQEITENFCAPERLG